MWCISKALTMPKPSCCRECLAAGVLGQCKNYQCQIIPCLCNDSSSQLQCERLQEGKGVRTQSSGIYGGAAC